MPKIYGYTEIQGDFLVTGSFSVLGSASTINTTSLVVSDSIIALGHSQSGSPVLDEGIMFVRGTGLTQAFIWDESDDTFALIGTNDDHTVIGNINIDSYSNLRVGGLTTSTLKLINGASNGYLLQSDASGNATWISATSASANFANTDLTFTGNREHSTNGYDLGITTDNGGYNESYFYLSTFNSEMGNSTNFIRVGTSSIEHSFGSIGYLYKIGNNEVVFNEYGSDVNFRIEGDTDSNLFFVDASTDNIGVGTNTPIYKLQVSGTISTTGFRMTSGASNGYYLKSDSSGNATWDLIPGGLTGSGTTNYLPKWTGTNTLSTTSSIYDDGSKIGILTNSPGATLDVRGSAVFNENGEEYDFRIEGLTNSNLFFVDASNDRIGIGTNTPISRVDIRGDVYSLNTSYQSSNWGFSTLIQNATTTNYGYIASIGGTQGSSNYGFWSNVQTTGRKNYGSQFVVNGATGNNISLSLGVGGTLTPSDGTDFGILNWINNSGTSQSTSYGIATYNNQTYTPSKVGISSQSSGSRASGTTTNLYTLTTDSISSAGTIYGIDNLVYGSANTKYGINNTLTLGNTTTYGMYTSIISGTTGQYFGNYININSGVGNNTWGVANNHGLYVSNYGSASTNNGVFTQVNYGDFANNAVWAVVGTPAFSAGDKAILAQISSQAYNKTSSAVTGEFTNASETTAASYGLNVSVSSTFSSANYGVYINSSGSSVNNYGVVVLRGTSVFNESGENYDFRIEGDTDQNLLFVDASTDRIGIGTNTPSYKLQVSGTVSTTGFRMNTGAVNGYVLTSDGSGNGTWQAAANAVNIYSSTQSYTSGTTYSINHGLNTNSIVLNLWDEITGELVVVNAIKTGTNTVDLNSTVTISSGRVVVIGG